MLDCFDIQTCLWRHWTPRHLWNLTDELTDVQNHTLNNTLANHMNLLKLLQTKTHKTWNHCLTLLSALHGKKHFTLAQRCLTHTYRSKYIKIKTCNGAVFHWLPPYWYLSCRPSPSASPGYSLRLRASSLCPCCQRKNSWTSAAESSFSPFVSTQDNIPNEKISSAAFALESKLLLFSRLSVPLSLGFVPEHAVLWPQSTQHFTDLWFLSLSFASQTPHSLIGFDSAPLSFLFSLSLSFFSAPAHSIPFIANGACGLWSLGLSLCGMSECVFSGR